MSFQSGAFQAGGAFQQSGDALPISIIGASATVDDIVAMTATISPTRLEFDAGDDLLVQFTVSRSGSAVDITGMTPRFVMRRRVGSTVIAGTEEMPETATAALVTPEDGVFTVAIDSTVTTGLQGTYKFEAELVDAYGDKQSVARGFFTFRRNLLS